jgi:hypothetical protein
MTEKAMPPLNEPPVVAVRLTVEKLPADIATERDAAAEPTATVTVAGAPGRTVDELKLTLTPVGIEADSVTAFWAEPLSVTEMVKTAELPA